MRDETDERGLAMKKVLFVGESWHVHVTESKGFDSFSYSYYEEATAYIKAALQGCGAEFHHIPSHLVEQEFPTTLEALAAYDVVMFSDVGANTLNLPMGVFQRLTPTINKLELVREYVQKGGAFCMIGGYLTFQGIQGRGCYKRTAIEELLPVTLLEGDDRVERCEGIAPSVTLPEHPVVAGLPATWPRVLGYNRLLPKADAEIAATVGDDPLVVLGSYGEGRVCAYATDCAPHWSPVEFCSWDGYSILWSNLLRWLTKDC